MREWRVRSLSKHEMGHVERFFLGWEETMIWSCLQGYMGNAFALEEELEGGKWEAKAASIEIADFCFFGGKADERLPDWRKKAYERRFAILIPQNECWTRVLSRIWGGRARSTVRYAFKKEWNAFDRLKLRAMAGSLSRELCITNLGEREFYEVQQSAWCRDWIAQFNGYDDFRSRGIGVVLKRGEDIVAGASSYTVYRGGIEVQIDTRRDYRGRGLGTVSGAALIMRCLDRGLYPSWDAQNKVSARLAQRLGYIFDREYEVLEINGDEGGEE